MRNVRGRKESILQGIEAANLKIQEFNKILAKNGEAQIAYMEVPAMDVLETQLILTV